MAYDQFFYVYRDHRGEWRWRFRAAGNHETIAVSSEGYDRKADCEAAIALLKRQAPTAMVVPES